MKNEVLSSLLPFIGESEFAYYGWLSENVFILLISLVPFGKSLENLRKLSKLNLHGLEKASEILLSMNENGREAYFNKLEVF